MTLFSHSLDSQKPLAELLRPKKLEEVIGQTHLLGKGKPLHHIITSGKIPSIILWGPPGIGKTTLARVIARSSDSEIFEISAVTAGVKDIKDVIKDAQRLRDVAGTPSILFIDEIHRFNKAQQDVILPHVETGVIKLIGSTTENPSFYVNPALRSRCKSYQLHSIPFEEMKAYLIQVLEKKFSDDKPTSFSDEILDNVVFSAGGDVRTLLNNLEIVVGYWESNEGNVSSEALADLLQKSSVLYDKNGNEHYDHASAFQKSLRGSDPDAAIYYLAKMIAAGEEPRFISRRLMITAAEDVGNADPQAFILAKSVAEAIETLGFPEARIPLAQAVLYVANAPKSNSALCAIDSALRDIESNGKSFQVPMHLRDGHYKDAKKYGHGVGYAYSHATPEKEQNFLPDELVGTTYYQPKHQNEQRYETQIEPKFVEKLLQLLEAEFQEEKEIHSLDVAKKLDVSQTKVVSTLFYLQREGKISLNQKFFIKIIQNDIVKS